MAKLTNGESEVLEFIRSYLIDHGAPPSIREIMARFGWKSTTWPTTVLKRLDAKKKIEFTPGAARGINVVDEWATLMRIIARLPIEDLRRVVRDCT